MINIRYEKLFHSLKYGIYLLHTPWAVIQPLMAGVVDISLKLVCSKVMDPDMALGSRSFLDVTIPPISAHSSLPFTSSHLSLST